MNSISPPDFESSLRSVLQALALEADSQVALYPPDRCVPCVLTLMLERWSQEFAGRSVLEQLPADHGHALEAVERASEAAFRNHRCHEDHQISEGAEYAQLRASAREALRIFGWPPGAADRRYLFGTAEYAERLTQAERERKRSQQAARRPGSAKLRYHQQLFKELGIRPVLSERNVELLRSRERTLRFEFPEAIFELLSLEGIAELFREHTNRDELVTNHEFDEWRKLERFGDPEEIAQGYLCVAMENQAVVGYYAALDGSPDPPVLHNNDQWLEDLSQVRWVPCADSFSAFVRQMMAR